MIEIDHTVETDKDKTLDSTMGDNHKTDIYNMDVTVGEEVVDIKIMIIEMAVEIERQNFRRNFSKDKYDNRDRSRRRDRSLTPRRNDSKRHDSPKTNVETRSRSNSRVTTNRDRIGCYSEENMIILQTNALMQSQMILMVMNQMEWHCN